MAYLFCTAFQLGVAKLSCWLTRVEIGKLLFQGSFPSSKAVVGLVKQDHVIDMHYTNNLTVAVHNWYDVLYFLLQYQRLYRCCTPRVVNLARMCPSM